MPRAGQKLQVFIDGVASDGRKLAVGDGLVLRPGGHHLELPLAAINLSSPQDIRLQHRMEDADPDWLDATDSRAMVYTNIPAGKHRLMVRATDSIGHWNSPQAVYEVTQQPHLSPTPLFQRGAIVVAGLILVLADPA